MPSNFTQYQPYVSGLVEFATSEVTEARNVWKKKVDVALNGQAGDQLQALVPVDTRREHGAFFTGHELAERLLSYVDLSKTRIPVFGDPTVGASDLLIASAKLLGRKSSFMRTLKAWNNQLLGIDLQNEFIQASKARLVLLARSLHNSLDEQTICWNSVFEGIYAGDGLLDTRLYKRATHLVMNPPFAKMNAPKGCEWARGNVNAAAVFIEHAVKHAKAGTQILAILPEVLRTGSRYMKWQQQITKMADVERIESVGLFHNADVDVFILVLRKRKVSATTGKTLRLAKRKKGIQQLGDFFKVSVGPVVPHRALEEGPLYRYLHAKNAKPWIPLVRWAEKRQFNGTVFTPPFVVIKRTSRPGDKHRAIASLVLGRAPVAVENHLIVCQPYDSKVTTCQELLRALQHPKVNAQLNKDMRCRHLTTKAVSAIPVW